MKKRIYKTFAIWNFEKEEAWLNEMSDKGYALSSVGIWRYDFEKCEPGEYTMKMELLKSFSNELERQEYISFVEDTGAELVGSLLGWVYFRKKKELGPFELFSDNPSRIKHLERIMYFLGFIGGVNLFAAFINSSFMEKESNNMISIFSLCVAFILFLGFYIVYKKKVKLEKDRNIYE